MRKTDKPVVMIRGNNNQVEVNVTINKASTLTVIAVVIIILMVMAAIVLAVAHYCPEYLAEAVRFCCNLISMVSGG